MWFDRKRVFALLFISVAAYALLFTQHLSHLFSLVSYPALWSNAHLVQPFLKKMQQSKSYTGLLAEHTNLEKRYEELERAYVQLQAQASYARGIKEVKKFAKRFLDSRTICQVLARNFSENEHSFLIDAGENKAIKRDMIVLYNDSLVGRITEVYAWYSKVSLITDTHCKIGAYCAATRAKGIHEGCNDCDAAQLKYVGHLAKVNEGELVLTSGEGLIFPEGFALGKVAQIDSDGLYKHISVKPLCDFHHIEYCSVLIRS